MLQLEKINSHLGCYFKYDREKITNLLAFFSPRVYRKLVNAIILSIRNRIAKRPSARPSVLALRFFKMSPRKQNIK
jgi:hypothetical protein